MALPNCGFCKIAAGKDEKTQLIYQDEKIIVFRDHKPAAEHHYLICPREHIKNAKGLTRKDLPLVELLHAVGTQVLMDQGADVSKTRFGYHWPPFTMINHLHLHAISPQDSLGFIARQMFKPNSWWFISHDWLVEKMKATNEEG